MRCRMLVLAAGLAALATPALADFYIVQDSGTKRCSIVEQRPTTQTSVIVGDGKVYTSRTEAEGALRTVKVCDSGGTVGDPRWDPPCLRRDRPEPELVSVRVGRADGFPCRPSQTQPRHGGAFFSQVSPASTGPL